MTKEEIAQFGRFCNRVANTLYDKDKMEEHRKVHELKNLIYQLFDEKVI